MGLCKDRFLNEKPNKKRSDHLNRPTKVNCWLSGSKKTLNRIVWIAKIYFRKRLVDISGARKAKFIRNSDCLDCPRWFLTNPSRQNSTIRLGRLRLLGSLGLQKWLSNVNYCNPSDPSSLSSPSRLRFGKQPQEIKNDCLRLKRSLGSWQSLEKSFSRPFPDFLGSGARGLGPWRHFLGGGIWDSCRLSAPRRVPRLWSEIQTS